MSMFTYSCWWDGWWCPCSLIFVDEMADDVHGDGEDDGGVLLRGYGVQRLEQKTILTSVSHNCRKEGRRTKGMSSYCVTSAPPLSFSDVMQRCGLRNYTSKFPKANYLQVQNFRFFWWWTIFAQSLYVYFIIMRALGVPLSCILRRYHKDFVTWFYTSGFFSEDPAWFQA